MGWFTPEEARKLQTTIYTRKVLDYLCRKHVL
jgi:hypothetical protein